MYGFLTYIRILEQSTVCCTVLADLVRWDMRRREKLVDQKKYGLLKRTGYV